jgi:4-amino-4-deoxy-L-arabinose transferase-like glycosyltransferase
MPAAGVQTVPTEELVFWGWYALWGTAAALCFARALSGSAVLRALRDVLERALRRPLRMAMFASALTFVGALLFRWLVLLDQPVADDELTYQLIARTLLQGRVVNPVELHPQFLINQFVVINENGWFGKYPIGHGAVLALGEAWGAIDLINPLIGAGGVLLTFAVGRRLFDARIAALACVLLALSPQYVWTCATWLSQPSSMLFMLAAMLCLLRLRDGGGLRWAALAGGALAAGFVVRPVPTAFFVLAAVASYFLDAPRPDFRDGLRRRLAELSLGGAVAALGPIAVLLVNRAQSSDVLVSGYHGWHSEVSVWGGAAAIAASLGGAMLRQNFWLLGWPFALPLLPWCRPRRGAVLFWGMLLGEYTYRVVVPKTVVSTTGPIYVMEATPLLCLGLVDGMRRVAARWRRRTPGGDPALSLALGGLLCAAVAFVPVQARAAHAGASERAAAFELIALSGSGRPLVFANRIVDPARRRTWAYYPPSPSPTLDDHVIFLRIPRGPRSVQTMQALRHGRFPRRTAFVLRMGDGGPRLLRLPPARPVSR